VLQRELINPMELVTTFMSYCDQPSDNQYVDVLRGRLPRRAERVLRGEARAQLERVWSSRSASSSRIARRDRRLRRQRGKSDPIDAEAAARTVLAGNASGAPKLATGPIEAIRMLRVATAGAVKAKTAAANKLLAVLVTTPEPLRSQLRQLSTAKLIDACLQLPPAPHEPPSPCPGRQTRAALDRHSSPSYRET
jgi:hypothetical protein